MRSHFVSILFAHTLCSVSFGAVPQPYHIFDNYSAHCQQYLQRSSGNVSLSNRAFDYNSTTKT
eukprot:m.1458964 g.1458964  ORF g.1458964 m.1458964 type:complete len:63 (+) comp25123_c0_seq30:208-396(+)